MDLVMEEGKKRIVWLHGGFFGSGRVSYDEDIRFRLHEAGWIVVSPLFSTHDFKRAILEIATVVEGMQVDAIGGHESGAAMAHIVSNSLYPHRHVPVVMLMPLLQPFKYKAKMSPWERETLHRMEHVDTNIKAMEKMIALPPLASTYIITCPGIRFPSRHLLRRWDYLDHVYIQRNLFLRPSSHEVLNAVQWLFTDREVDTT